MPVRDWFSGNFSGTDRRLRRAGEILAEAFAAGPPAGPALDRALQAYHDAVELGLPRDPHQAAAVVATYDAHMPPGRYPFTPADRGWLTPFATGDDADASTVVFTIASRVPLPDLQTAARDGLAYAAARSGRADLLVRQLLRFRAAGVLDAPTLAAALTLHLDRRPLDDDAALWRGFLDDLPEPVRPDLFEVHRFLGHGADAARLAVTPTERARAAELCAASTRTSDHEAGLRLAADLPALQSVLHEKLGNLDAALRTCPTDQPDRIAALVARRGPEVDALIAAGDPPAAARLVKALLQYLGTAHPETTMITTARDELTATRSAVLAAGRRHFARQAPGEDLYRAWSAFAEDCGDPAEAARYAEESGDVYRAHQLFRAAGRFGDADRVLRADSSDAGITARAAARAAAGDPAGAARLHEQSGRHADAATLYARAGDHAAAARCLIAAGGGDDPRLAEWLRKAGALEQLAELSLKHQAVDELRRLRGDQALPAELQARVAAAVDRLEGHRRAGFDARVQAWVAQARIEIDTRYAGIWALDLGTTTCSAAIYDTQARRAVLCPWKGRDQFASTVSFDADGNEVIGLAGEDLLAPWIVGQIRDVKRGMGSNRRYRFRDRRYRPEQIAGLFIAHGRRVVENFLAERVRERVAELARSELGEVRDEWVTDAERHNDMRLDRPRALLTIPAYFLNNQKHATRDACKVARVDAVRLIHEPTAACMSAARDRDLSGRIVVVDLGAGTLDVSLLDVSEGVYDVEQVLGDNHYGGRDFDEAIGKALKAKLSRDGVEVPDSARRRLDVAAEYLKISLSAQQEAEYLLRDFAGRDVWLRLTRAELAEILKEPLESLRRTCAAFRKELRDQPQHLVLVGGPMLSPLIQGVVEAVFGLRRTVLRDPRTAVAIGAALQAAVLDGKLSEVLLLDVVPLPLGLRVLGFRGENKDQKVDEFEELIPRNARIPTQKEQVFTTTVDNQDAVNIEIFNGSLDAAARVGHFLLGDLPPAPAGTPKIEVRFAIDASCVLEVTAQDLGSGRSRSIRVTDTTLLSPAEISDMAQRQERQVALEDLRRDLADLIDDDVPTGAEATLRQFRIRLAGHRGATPPTDPEARRQLASIVAEADDADRELTAAIAPLRDLMVNAREFLRRGVGADEALAQGRHLMRELRDGLDRVQARLARIDRWNGTLTRLSMAGSDPLQRFRHRHDTGEYAAALRSLAEVGEPLNDPDDRRRHLRCLAETGDAEGYRRAIGLVPPDDLRAYVARSTVPVVVRTSDGTRVDGLGFVVGGSLVATNRHWVSQNGTVEAGAIPVTKIETPENKRLDLALLRTARPLDGPVLPLGHTKLVHVGDAVAGPDSDGLVDGFESFPDEGLRLVRTSLSVPPARSGGPVVNDLGEVIGILTVAGDKPGGFALTVEALAELITASA